MRAVILFILLSFLFNVAVASAADGAVSVTTKSGEPPPPPPPWSLSIFI